MTIIETIILYVFCGIGFVIAIGSMVFLGMLLWSISQ